MTRWGKAMTVSLHEFARRFVKARTRQAFRSAVSGLLCEFKLDSLHRASLKKARRFASERGLKLQFGCGSITKTGWVNIDLYSEKADLQLDARDPFPFADRSVSLIYSEHFLNTSNIRRKLSASSQNHGVCCTSMASLAWVF